MQLLIHNFKLILRNYNEINNYNKLSIFKGRLLFRFSWILKEQFKKHKNRIIKNKVYVDFSKNFKKIFLFD